MSMRIICLIVGFAFGSIPNGYLIARSKGVDIRHTGSGNVGTTNVLRSMGKKYGALTLLLDMAKAIVPIIIMQLFYGDIYETRYITTMYTGLGAVLGHDFSPWLNFNGGKGVATSGGVLLTTDPILITVTLAMVFITAKVTGYVSLGSLMASVVYIAFNLFVAITGHVPGWPFYPQYFSPSHRFEIIAVALIMAGITVFRHKANIIRLINGTENKIKL